MVGNYTLYTIYRTNWFRGGRLSYDAATIVVNTNNIFDNALIILKLLIKSYVVQKATGNPFNLDSIIDKVKLRPKDSNEGRVVTMKYRQGYIKYQTEAELGAFFIDRKDKLHNFNKVFFFTRLGYFEEGPKKIQNLLGYKAIRITLENFDAQYHRVYVENNQINILGGSFSAYEGEKIVIYCMKGGKKREEKKEIAMSGLSITLPKIKHSRRSKGGSGGSRGRGGNQRLAIIGSALLLLLLLGVYFYNDISGLFSKTGKSNTADLVIDSWDLDFQEGYFVNSNEKNIKDEKELLEHFSKGSITVYTAKKEHKYRLNSDESDIEYLEDGKWVYSLVKLNDLYDVLQESFEQKNDSISNISETSIDKTNNLDSCSTKNEELDNDLTHHEELDFSLQENIDKNYSTIKQLQSQKRANKQSISKLEKELATIKKTQKILEQSSSAILFVKEITQEVLNYYNLTDIKDGTGLVGKSEIWKISKEGVLTFQKRNQKKVNSEFKNYNFGEDTKSDDLIDDFLKQKLSEKKFKEVIALLKVDEDVD